VSALMTVLSTVNWANVGVEVVRRVWSKPSRFAHSLVSTVLAPMAIDAGVVTGATSITSTAFVGALTGNADTVTTNANLTGPITSSGNATSIAAQTGTGTTFVVQTSPTLTTPNIGVATATSIAIGANTVDTNEWANLDGLDQTLLTTSTPTFAQLTVDNTVINADTLTVTGTLAFDSSVRTTVDTAVSVASAAGAVLDALQVQGDTVTITGATSITTAAGFNLVDVKAPTYSAASALTITNAAAVYIANAPAGGGAGPATITNAYALWVDAGTSRFDGAVTYGSQATFTDSDATPDVSSGSHFITNTTTFTITDFDAGSGTLQAGHIIFVESAGAITYDIDGGLLQAGAVDLVTATGDLTSWIYDGTDWLLINWMDDSDTQTGADIAEMFPSLEQLEPGDVVVADAGYPVHVKKSTTTYERQVLGIVSTQPGIILKDPNTKTEGEIYPIALAGRVSVKVSLENGPIVIGDFLTSSFAPGVAMKATATGNVIGTALGAYDGTQETDTVMVFVNMGWQGSLESSLTVLGDNFSFDGVLRVVDAVFEGNIIVRGHATFNEDTVGQAKILVGDTKVRITFGKEYEYLPIVTATPVGVHDMNYGVEDIHTTGFSMRMESSQNENIIFNWHAFSSIEETKIFVSDGSVQDISIVVQNSPEEPLAGQSPQTEEQTVNEGQPVPEATSEPTLEQDTSQASPSSEPTGEPSPEPTAEPEPPPAPTPEEQPVKEPALEPDTAQVLPSSEPTEDTQTPDAPVLEEEEIIPQKEPAPALAPEPTVEPTAEPPVPLEPVNEQPEV